MIKLEEYACLINKDGIIITQYVIYIYIHVYIYIYITIMQYYYSTARSNYFCLQPCDDTIMGCTLTSSQYNLGRIRMQYSQLVEGGAIAELEHFPLVAYSKVGKPV